MIVEVVQSFLKDFFISISFLITLIIDANLSYDFFPKIEKINFSIDSMHQSSNSSSRFVNGTQDRGTTTFVNHIF